MSCCGCFAGLGGGGGGGGDRAPREEETGSLLEQKSRSQREIASFHGGLDFIPKVPLFKSLPMSDHPALAKAFELRSYASGQAVITQGDDGDRFFLIKSGIAKVIVDGKLLAKLKEGDYFGESALLHKLPRNATIEAEGPLECQELSQQAFEGLGLRSKCRFQKRKAMVQNEAALDVESRRISVPPVKKNPAQTALILEAVRNDKNVGPFLAELRDQELQGLVDRAFAREVTADTTEVITQGQLKADLFYILESGSGKAIKDGTEVATYKDKDAFGGLALLYQAARAATVRVTPGSKLWCIPRAALREVLRKQVQQKVDGYAQILSRVKCLDHVSSSDKRTLADALMETTYYKDEFIIKQGEVGQSFFILNSGECCVMQQLRQVTTYKAEPGKELPHFGERALITDEPRAASVRVMSVKATVLVLNRDVYLQVVKPNDDCDIEGTVQYDFTKLTTVGLLGCGGFGKVTLVIDSVTGLPFALKALSKGHILSLQQQACVMNEKKILKLTHNPFLIQVAATFNRPQHLMFLLEPAMGGELFTIYIKNSFTGNEKLAMFYTACVTRGLEHLHERCIIYRDMKPENLLLDQKGYCKIADFGLAKFVIGKTFTTCGTPDYFAPELVKGIGHNVALDWWTLGILIYEFMLGVTPFQADDPSQLIAKVNKGIEKAHFPKTNPMWADLVKALCKQDPSERIAMRPGGSQNICSHKWYTSKQFDWASLTDRTMPAPWDPGVKGIDVSNFDACEDDAPPQIPYRDPENGWDDEFADHAGPATFD